MRLALSLCLILCSACRSDKQDSGAATQDSAPALVDEDSDGFDASEDCDDADASIHPGAEESCNELDDDCDGEIDEGLTTTWHPDADGDGFGEHDHA